MTNTFVWIAIPRIVVDQGIAFAVHVFNNSDDANNFANNDNDYVVICKRVK